MNKGSTLYTTIFSFVVTFLFVGILALIDGWTKPLVLANIQIAERTSVLRALDIPYTPGDLENINSQYSRIEVRFFEKQDDGSYKDIGDQVSSEQELEEISRFSTDPNQYETLFFLISEGEELVAKKFIGAGLWGPIEGVFVANRDLTRARGLEIISHNETPGLGARIAEEEFLSQVRNQAIVEKRIQVVKMGKAAPLDGSSKDDGKIDAITGATRTSDAMTEIFTKTIRTMGAILEDLE